MHTIYLITNSVNNKKYVGQTCQNYKNRWSQHKSKSKGYCLKNKKLPLYNAMRKYGVENFYFKVILTTKELEVANKLEEYLINSLFTLLPNGYNVLPGGKNCVNLETRKKISELRMGFKHSEESKRKMSISSKGKIASEETKTKMSLANMGRKISEEAMQRRIATLKKNQAKINFIHPNYGKTRSEEAKLKTKQTIEERKIKKEWSYPVRKEKMTEQEKIRRKTTIERKKRIILFVLSYFSQFL